MATPKERRSAAFRVTTAKLMDCKECGQRMLIASHGIVCEQGCGKIIDPGVDRAQLILAWPDRVLSTARGVEASRQARASKEARKSDPALFDKGSPDDEPDQYV